MPHRIPLISEVLLASLAAIIAACSRMLLAVVPESEVDLYRWTLLPMIGGVLTTIGAFCFNTEPEVRKIVVGRCTFAFIVAVVGPRLVFVISPWGVIRDTMVDPLLLIGAGAVCAFAAYILSYPFARAAYRRAPAIAAAKLKEVEQRLGTAEEPPTKRLP